MSRRRCCVGNPAWSVPRSDVIVLGWYRYHYRKQGAQVKCAAQHRPPGTIAADSGARQWHRSAEFPCIRKFPAFSPLSADPPPVAATQLPASGTDAPYCISQIVSAIINPVVPTASMPVVPAAVLLAVTIADRKEVSIAGASRQHGSEVTRGKACVLKLSCSPAPGHTPDRLPWRAHPVPRSARAACIRNFSIESTRGCASAAGIFSPNFSGRDERGNQKT